MRKELGAAWRCIIEALDESWALSIASCHKFPGVCCKRHYRKNTISLKRLKNRDEMSIRFCYMFYIEGNDSLQIGQAVLYCSQLAIHCP